jgi:hypothetical protein
VNPGTAWAGTGSTAAGATVDRTVQDLRVAESSGLLASEEHAGIVWTNNDSGNAAGLYAIDTDGSTAATLWVSGVPNVDWEALAPVRAPDGTRLLAIGDIGDNDGVRERIEIDLVPEPASLRDDRADPVAVLKLQYPDEAIDAEALLADPGTGLLYIVTKGLLGGTVYQVPDTVWPGDSDADTVRAGTLQRIGDVGLPLVTDGWVLSDSRVLLRSYSTLAILAPLPTAQKAQGRLSLLKRMPLPTQDQGEGLTVDDEGSRTVLVSSEGTEQEILRVPADDAFWEAAADPGTSETTASPTGAETPTEKEEPGGAAVPGNFLALGVLLTIVLGVGIALGMRSQH